MGQENAGQQGSWRLAVQNAVKKDELTVLHKNFVRDNLTVLDKLMILGEAIECCHKQRNKYCDILEKSSSMKGIKTALKIKAPHPKIATEIDASITIIQLVKIHENIRSVLAQSQEVASDIALLYMDGRDDSDNIIDELSASLDSGRTGKFSALLSNSQYPILSKLWILGQVLKFYNEQEKKCCDMLYVQHSIEDIREVVYEHAEESTAPSINCNSMLDIIKSQDTIKDLLKTYMRIDIVEKSIRDLSAQQHEQQNVSWEIAGDNVSIDTSDIA